MRTLVDLPGPQVQALDRLAKRRARSRAALIREAVDDYLSRHERRSSDEAFGLWSADPVDALAFEDRIRNEW